MINFKNMKKFIFIGALFGFFSGLTLTMIIPEWLKLFANLLQYAFLLFIWEPLFTFLGNTFNIQSSIWHAIFITTITGALYGFIIYKIYSAIKKKSVSPNL